MEILPENSECIFAKLRQPRWRGIALSALKRQPPLAAQLQLATQAFAEEKAVAELILGIDSHCILAYQHGSQDNVGDISAGDLRPSHTLGLRSTSRHLAIPSGGTAPPTKRGGRQ